MPKKKEKKRCQYDYPRLVDEECPYDYFATYADPATGETTDYCIFHAPMELKGDSVDEFWEAFDAHFEEMKAKYDAPKTEEEKKKVWLDCKGFVFPDTGNRFEDKEFPFSVSFLRATFAGDTEFREATFKGGTNFRGATFAGKASFRGAVFTGVAVFDRAIFKRWVHFQKAIFERWAYFKGATFNSVAYFRGVTFKRMVSFRSTTFKSRVYFRKTIFESKAYFRRLSIIGRLDFQYVELPKLVSFSDVKISGELRFRETQFREDAEFRDIKTYLVDNEGNGTYPDVSLGALLFDNTYFHQPERMQLGGKETDLGQWSFKDTNIENVNFVNEEWQPKVRRRRKYEKAPLKVKFWPFKLKGRKVVYDEILASEDKDKADDERRVTWEDAGQVYRRLRVKFEGELAYELTTDFHYGQMECRRLNSDRSLLHPDRVVAFLYKIVSGYGERFGLPLLWLLGSFAVFTGAFMSLGYKPAGENEVIWRFCSPGEMFASGLWNWVLDLGKAVTFTLRAAVSFRLEGITKDPVIFLAYFWKLFAVIFGTFFILALRRRFKK